MAATGTDTGASPSSFTEFDFVVMGGGLSGLVLAARLSEDSDVTVGVLEAGPWRAGDPMIEIPSRTLEMFLNPEYQFVTLTVPQKNVGARQLPCPRGRVLGGGSSVNFMVWHRGSRNEYDGFETLGNPGWNFESLARAGRKSEKFYPPDTADQMAIASTDPSFHGTDGPIQTSFSGWVDETQKAFFEVLEKSFGLARNDQWHNGITTGIRASTSSLDPRTGKRSSSETAYFLPNASRSNLSVLCGAQATKVELEYKDGLQTATGVHYVVDEQSHFVKARKEVIISAGEYLFVGEAPHSISLTRTKSGAFESPQLLELSGIGNPSILQPLDIVVKINNPNVGENMQDHVMSWMNYLTKPGQHTQDALHISEYAKEAAAAYAAPSKTQCHGPLAGTHCGTLYFSPQDVIPKLELEEMKSQLYEETQPLAANVGIKFQLDNIDDPGRGSIEWACTSHRLPTATPPEPGRSYIAFMTAMQHPISRGHTHIVSSDPKAHPAIDPHYLESFWDKELLLRSLEYLDKASREEPLASFIDRRTDPPPNDNSRSFFAKYVEDATIPGVHWIGTASMLPREKGGVVDPKCKVYGTRNLRVVDASIIPLHISAHPQATLYAVAELAAELIIDDHKQA